MKIKISFLSLLILLIFSFKSNAQRSDDYKYLMVLNYLHSDSAMIEKIKGLYSRIKLVTKKAKHVEFNIIDKIGFIAVQAFRYNDSLKASELGIDQKLIDSYELYRQKFYFKPFESFFLKNIAYPNSSQLFLTFSKGVGNYIIADLCNNNRGPNVNRRTGIGMSILFIFDSDGFIKRTIITAGVYN